MSGADPAAARLRERIARLPDLPAAEARLRAATVAPAAWRGPPVDGETIRRLSWRGRGAEKGAPPLRPADARRRRPEMEEAREALASTRKAWADLEEELGALEEARGVPEPEPDGRVSAEVALLVGSVERLDPHLLPGMGGSPHSAGWPSAWSAGKASMAARVGTGLFAAAVLVAVGHPASLIHLASILGGGKGDPADDAEEKRWRLARKRLMAGSQAQRYRKVAAEVTLALSNALPGWDEGVAPVLDGVREVAGHPGHRTKWREFVGAVEARVGVLHRRHLLARAGSLLGS